MSRLRLAVALIPVVLLLQSCQLLDSEESFSIPESYEQSDTSYTLLYSTLGYDTAATKHVLIRQNDASAPVASGLAFQWRLVDADSEDVVETGLAQYGGTSWSIPMWVADFTDVQRPGSYRMSIEATNVGLATGVFDVDEFLLTRKTLVRVGLDAADVRSAPIELDNGYFEPHSLEGTSAAHAEFMLGLIALYEERRSSLTEAMRVRAKAAIDRAFEYVMLLSDAGTGEIAHAAPTRPYAFGDNPSDTVAGARGLARYAAAFQREDPGNAERAYRRARLADAWLESNAPEAYAPWARAAVAFDLYMYVGDPALLDRAVVAVRSFAESYDLPSMNRFSGDTMPHFETMRQLWELLPEHPDRALWERTAARVGAQYVEMLDRHAIGIVPPGIDHAGGPSAVDQWNTVASDPLPGDGDSAMIGNEWFLARAVDAAQFARMLDDPRLEESATAHLLWVTGLNPGMPAERVPGSVRPASGIQAASFVVGVDSVAVMPAREWEWQRPEPAGDILAGFRRALTFDDSLTAGSSSITRNGLWLQSVVAYEELIHPRDRAPTLIEGEDEAATMRVASAVRTNAVDRFTVTVTIVDADGTPLSDAVVSAVWTGILQPGQSPENGILVDECETVAGGSCSLTLDEVDAPSGSPHTLLITGLEHSRNAFVPGSGVLPPPLVFD